MNFEGISIISAGRVADRAATRWAIEAALDNLDQPIEAGAKIKLQLVVFPGDKAGRFRVASSEIIEATGHACRDRGGVVELEAVSLLYDGSLPSDLIEAASLNSLASENGFLLSRVKSDVVSVSTGMQNSRLISRTTPRRPTVLISPGGLNQSGRFVGALEALISFKPGFRKNRVLFGRDNKPGYDGVTADLLSLIPPVLSIIELNQLPSPNEGGSFLCSPDPVAIDSFLGVLTGDSHLIRLSAEAAGAGLGMLYPEGISLCGAENLPEFGRSADSKQWSNRCADSLYRVLADFASASPMIDTTACNGCCECVTSCQSGALTSAGEGLPPRFEKQKCNECLLCCERCPKGTISVQTNRIADFLLNRWRRNCAV